MLTDLDQVRPALRRRRALALALAATAVVAACSSSGAATTGAKPSAVSSAASSATHAAAFPVTIQGANGTLTLTKKPTTIVSLSPTATEMLFAIGAGDQVKAVDKNSDYPASAPHSNLDAYQLNVEAVAKYQPDLIVTSGLTPAQTKQLTTLHLPVLDEPAAANLDGSYHQLMQLGQATGHVAEAAAEVSTMRHDVAQLVDSVKGSPRPATYYYELDQTYYSVTSSTFVGQVLKLLGLSSIADSARGAAASGGYPQLSSEFIIKANPDYVFLADTRCCKQSPASVRARPGWATMHALSSGHVVGLDDDIASRWGPRIVTLMRIVAAAVKGAGTS